MFGDVKHCDKMAFQRVDSSDAFCHETEHYEQYD